MLFQFDNRPKASGSDAEGDEEDGDGGQEVLPPLAVAAEAEEEISTSSPSLCLNAGEEAQEDQEDSHHFLEQFVSPADMLF